MKKIISSKFFIFSALFLLVLSFGIFEQKTNLFTTEVANAGSGDNVTGWIWANTPQSPDGGNPTTDADQGIGWISLNCVDREAAESKTCLDRNDASFNSDDNIVDYGVNIDENTGDFSGAAWSENIGWISFDRVDTEDPFSNDFGGGSGAIANIDADTRIVTGWARALSGIGGSGGFDGWISLNSANCDTNTNNGFVDVACGGDDTTTVLVPYGVTLNASNEFEGYAWGGDVIGWVNFDPDGTAGGTGAVFGGALNQAPGPMNITAPATGLTGEAITYTFQAPDGSEPPDDVRYYVDWESDGSIDAWYPSSSAYVPSNTSGTIDKTWSLDGVYTVSAWAEDENGAVSPVATKPITISIPQCSNGVNDDTEDTLIDEDDPGCWINPSLGYSLANYNSQDNNETDPQCYNSNVDDDGDIVADAADPGCWATPGLPSSYDASDDDENNCGNDLCEVSANENFINCSADCSGKFEEF